MSVVQCRRKFCVEVSPLQNPPAFFKTYAQIFVRIESGLKLGRRNNLDLKLENRLCPGVHETAVSVLEYLKKFGARGADQNGQRADLDDHVMRDGRDHQFDHKGAVILDNLPSRSSSRTHSSEFCSIQDPTLFFQTGERAT